MYNGLSYGSRMGPEAIPFSHILTSLTAKLYSARKTSKAARDL